MKLLIDPYPYQKEGIEFAFRNKYSINAFTMGLGKTLVGIGLAVRASSHKVLVVCPAFLVNNWRREIEKFCSHPERFTVVSYASLEKLRKDFRTFDCIIGDEAHYLKNIHAKRTKALHDLIGKHRPATCILLTGTPIKNRVPEFFSLLRLVWLGGTYKKFDIFANSFWKFQETFSHRRQISIGSRSISKYEGVKNAPYLLDLLKPIYLRKRAEDVLNLPKQVHTNLVMRDAAAHDGELEKAWQSYQGEGDRTSFSAAKAINALSKVNYTAEYVKELIEQDISGVVVFSDHVQAVQELTSRIGIDVAKSVTGATDMKVRDKYVQDLNAGNIKVLVSTIGALSVGVNITGVNYMVFNDFAWVEADMEQARKRIHRIGQKKTCFYYYVLSSKIDEYIFNTLKKKQKLMAEVVQ